MTAGVGLAASFVSSDEGTRELWYQAAEWQGIPRLLLLDRDGILGADCSPEQPEDEVKKLLDRPEKP